MTPSVSTPKDQAREDERVEKKSLSNSDRLRVATSYHREKLPPGFAQELFEFADEWDEELESASVSPSPADPVRAALESAKQFIENGVELGFIRMPVSGDPALDTLPKILAALSTLSNPPGRQGEEEADLSYSGNPMPPNGAEGCVYCGEAFKEGDLVLPEVDGGEGHVACCGPERDSYVGADGEPLKDGDPIPTGYPWNPAAPTPSPAVPGSGEGK